MIARVSEQGYDARYRARALKREIQRQIVMPIAALLAERNPTPGEVLKLDTTHAGASASGVETTVRVLSSEQSLAHDRASRPVRDQGGRSFTRHELLEALKATRRRIVSISLCGVYRQWALWRGH